MHTVTILHVTAIGKTINYGTPFAPVKNTLAFPLVLRLFRAS